MSLLSRLLDALCGPEVEPEQWNIDTGDLYVGKQLWCGRGWFTIVRMVPGTVWVVPAEG